MPKITIDNQTIDVPSETSILDAARQLDIDIPALCYLEGCDASTSCLACVVRVDGAQRLVPSCATRVVDGMVVESETDEIHAARREALELLLSDHVGDCMGPCQTICPANMNIPLMIRQIGAGALDKAIQTVKRDIALPAILGRICPAPCENGCRRKFQDSAVSICHLKRYAADVDLNSGNPWLPECQASIGRKVAIIGSGPTGLAAAWHLLPMGIGCVIFDQNDQPGGSLLDVSQEQLSREVLLKEIEVIGKLGAEFRLKTRIADLEALQKDFDAVLIAGGASDEALPWGLETTGQGLKVDVTFQSSQAGVFAAGSVVRHRKMAISAVADGKLAARAIGQSLTGQELTAPEKPFNSRMGKLQEGEIDAFMVGASHSDRNPLKISSPEGFTDQQARDEAARCLHCDCRKPGQCKLRDISQAYHASQGRFKAERQLFDKPVTACIGHDGDREVVYESGKCIKCGLCIQISGRGDGVGLAFTGRGFDVRVSVPFGKSLSEALGDTAAECVKACPTGALSFD